jgi:hypothetical protein
MSRTLFFLVLALALFSPRISSAQDTLAPDDGPSISITSPDTASTFVFGTIKNHALIWNKAAKLLIARVTFVDAQQDNSQAYDDTHDFRLPGVTFDAATGVFSATSAKGEVIPIARIKKVLFINTIETLPNAVIRVLHPKGNVTVILEAISPNDPAMHAPPDNPNGTHQVDIDKILK